jgi:hypothetical protein
MDKDRQIRMLVPPFFMIASVLWGAYLSNNLVSLIHATAGDEANSVRSVLAVLGVGAATLPAGYAIGAVTIFGLRVFLPRLFPLRNYEIPISPKTMEEIRQRLRVPAAMTSNLCAAATFDHVELHPKIHEWLLRRLNSFNISVQCVMALLLSIPLGLAFHIPFWEWDMWVWWATTVGLSIILIWNAVAAWRECRMMFDFAVDVPAALHRPRPRRPSTRSNIA